MKDRIPRHAGRVRIKPVEGYSDLFDVERADEPIQEGTKLNKALFDYALAANGVTEGNGKDYSLTKGAEGFTLVDGAKVNFALNVKSQSNPKLNINNTGAKPIIGASKTPLSAGIEAGIWITAVYSESLDAYVVIGSASGMSGDIKLKADEWDDSSNMSNTRAVRIYAGGQWGDWLTSKQGDQFSTKDVEYAGTYNNTQNDKVFMLGFAGSVNANHLQPYEVTSIKLWKMSDPEETNLLGEFDTFKIEESHMESAIVADENQTFMRVWTQGTDVGNALNTVLVNTGVTIDAGEYGFSYTIRVARNRIVQLVKLDGATLKNATVVKSYSNNGNVYEGVKCVAQGDGVLLFSCDEVPKSNITAMAFTINSNNNTIIDCTDKAPRVITGTYVGDGSGVGVYEFTNWVDVSAGDNYRPADFVKSAGFSRVIEFPFELGGVIITREGGDQSVIVAQKSAAKTKLEKGKYDWVLNGRNGKSGYDSVRDELWIELSSDPYYEFCNVDKNKLNLDAQIKFISNANGVRDVFIDFGWNYMDWEYAIYEIDTPYGTGYVESDRNGNPKAEYIETTPTTIPDTLNDAGVTYHYIAWGV